MSNHPLPEENEAAKVDPVARVEALGLAQVPFPYCGGEVIMIAGPCAFGLGRGRSGLR
jgi:hypothetical protein